MQKSSPIQLKSSDCKQTRENLVCLQSFLFKTIVISRLMLEINLLDAQHTLDKVSQLNRQIDDITSEMDYLKQGLEAIK